METVLTDSPDPETHKEEAACQCCGFVEEIEFMVQSDATDKTYLCRECHVYEAPELYVDQFALVFMPDVTAKAISLIFKAKLAVAKHGAAWATELESKCNFLTSNLQDKDRDDLNTFMNVVTARYNKTSMVETSPFTMFFNWLSDMQLDLKDRFVFDNTSVIHGTALEHFIARRQKLPDEERVVIDFGTRFIPLKFAKDRISSWQQGALKRSIFDRLLELSREYAQRAPDLIEPISRAVTMPRPRVFKTQGFMAPEPLETSTLASAIADADADPEANTQHSKAQDDEWATWPTVDEFSDLLKEIPEEDAPLSTHETFLNQSVEAKVHSEKSIFKLIAGIFLKKE